MSAVVCGAIGRLRGEWSRADDVGRKRQAVHAKSDANARTDFLIDFFSHTIHHSHVCACQTHLVCIDTVASIRKSLWLEILFDWTSIAPSDTVHVVHFERIKEDQTRELRSVCVSQEIGFLATVYCPCRKIGRFLRGTEMSDLRLSCLEEFELRNFQRTGKPKLEEDVFPEKVMMTQK